MVGYYEVKSKVKAQLERKKNKKREKIKKLLKKSIKNKNNIKWQHYLTIKYQLHIKV
jgi:hypothetical protein